MNGIDYRTEARGRQCLIRLDGPEPHKHDRTTVVLHHCRSRKLFAPKAMDWKKPKREQTKPPDIFGAWVCGKCHDILNNPAAYGWNEDEINLEERNAIIRTQYQLHLEGKL